MTPLLASFLGVTVDVVLVWPTLSQQYMTLGSGALSASNMDSGGSGMRGGATGLATQRGCDHLVHSHDGTAQGVPCRHAGTVPPDGGEAFLPHGHR
jgi:hypothetical protein